MTSILITLSIWFSLSSQSPAAAKANEQRIFNHDQAEVARKLAQRECKPLVIHVVPNSRHGSDQLRQYYGEFGAVSRSLLEQVVIVVLPQDRYARFAQQLGIRDAGGFRTISAYDLNTLDSRSVTTCRAGFI